MSCYIPDYCTGTITDILYVLFIDCPATLDLPAIETSMSCYIPDYCTGINCCIEVDQIGKTFNVFALFDSCNWRLTIGIERRKIDILLLNYTWGKIALKE